MILVLKNRLHEETARAFEPHSRHDVAGDQVETHFNRLSRAPELRGEVDHHSSDEDGEQVASTTFSRCQFIGTARWRDSPHHHGVASVGRCSDRETDALRGVASKEQPQSGGRATVDLDLDFHFDVELPFDFDRHLQGHDVDDDHDPTIGCVSQPSTPGFGDDYDARGATVPDDHYFHPDYRDYERSTGDDHDDRASNDYHERASRDHDDQRAAGHHDDQRASRNHDDRCTGGRATVDDRHRR